MRFRSDNPFAHPIRGQVVSTHGVVCKIVRRRYRRPGQNGAPDQFREEIISVDLVGTCTEACRFREIADFQYHVPHSDPIFQLRQALDRFDVDFMNKFQFTRELKQTVVFKGDCRMISPPMFSRIQNPLEYNYRQIGSAVVVQEEDGQIRLENRLKNKPQHLSGISFSRDPLASPPDSLEHPTDPAGQKQIERLRVLFDKRPVWTRNALESELPEPDHKVLRQRLPLVAFYYISGPWRTCWVRYGFDPRLDSSTRFFQVLDLRLPKNPRFAKKHVILVCFF